MTIVRRAFFDRVRHSPFSGRLCALQVAGLEALLSGWEARRTGASEDDSPSQLAYVLATAFHETAATMQPVRETLAGSDAEAIARLDRAYAAGRLSSVRTPYWRRDADGKSWLGRGFVQLTHKQNYACLSNLTGIDLVADPARAMEMDTAVAILIDGMRAGSFTGRRLADHFCTGTGKDGPKADWTGARRIINGRDRAALVAGYGRAFLAALG